MTQKRNQTEQRGFPGSTQVPGTTNPDPVREPWDPRREPLGAPMPWENDTDAVPTSRDNDQEQRPLKR